MPIHYYLKPNSVLTSTTAYRATVTGYKSHDVKSLILEMLKRGSTLTEADILASLQLLTEVITDEVIDGNHINLPFAKIKPGIGGNFNSPEDGFDKERHRIKATISPGSFLIKKLKDAEVVKVKPYIPSPIVLEFCDIESDKINSILTPGGIGKVSGNNFKFNSSETLEGIFLITAAGMETKVVKIATSSQKQIVFSIPNNLEAGEYSLEVRKGYGNNQSSLRTGKLSFTLKVI